MEELHEEWEANPTPSDAAPPLHMQPHHCEVPQFQKDNDEHLFRTIFEAWR